MYLKRIELLGFKSFSAKTRIALEPGISCIVGPNGSGKSNISDALRWVMGEQSARSIRGGKLEDVIFGGSKKRRPLGMAEVTITLDNSDGYLPLEYTEVTVTRRAIRGGASEYYINNQACRLKDIRDLFVDTGVGVEGVSLINQGRVQEMVACRPEDRRVLVEEAAGIVKYRDRKREAARKLEETQRHLERLGDIISELNSRLEPLRLQAETAKQFLTLQQEADRMEIGVSVRVLSEAEEKIAGYDQEIQNLGQQLLEQETRRLQAATAAEELRHQLSAIDQQVAAASKEYYDLQASREKVEGEINTARALRDSTDANRQRWQEELAALEQSLSDKQAEAQALTVHISRTRQELEQQEQQVLSGESGDGDLRQALALREEKLEQARSHSNELAASVAAMQSKNQFSRQLTEKNSQAQGRLAEEAQTLKEEQQRLSARLQETEGHLAQLNQESQAAAGAVNTTGQEIKRLSGCGQEQAAAEADCRYQVHSLQTKVSMLTEMSAGYQGFFPGVKGLMTACRQSKGPAGILGVLAELMDVPADYRVAVEAYLGSGLQNIVVENAAAAKAAVAYLKKNQLGRATFLPLDILQVREARDFRSVQALPGVFGRASALIGCEQRFRPAVDFMLNNLLICNNMDTALLAADKLRYRSSIVTLDGDMVNPGGAVSGGSRQTKAGDILGQKARLAEAKAQLAQAQEDLKQQEHDTALLRRQMEQANQANEEARERLRALSAATAEANSSRERDRFQLAEGQKRLQAVSAEWEDLAAEAAGLGEDLDMAEGERAALEQEYAQAQQEQEQAQTALLQAQQRLEQGRTAATEQKMAVAGSREKLRGQSLTLERLQREIEELGWEAEGRLADRDQAAAQLETYGTSIADGQTHLLAIVSQYHDAELRLEQIRHGYAAENARLQELDRQDREQLREEDRLKGELHQQQLRRERWQADFENEAAKLGEKFQLDLAGAIARLGEESASRSAMLQRLNQLRRDIAALGPVNVGAIEEYQEVGERYEFLTGQRDDMLEARAKLDGVIQEMDAIMTTRFKEAYQQLNAAFGVSFRRLFGGGEAALVLSDPEHILETGVEISVHPPGKKVVNYSLLSGGEQSLIGIALMFATLMVRPTPFCFMDEVDAALDEANIDRFTAYLRDEAHHCQFVMITHRQGTMDAASSLWGVTMEEEGISKVIGVRMSENLKEAEQKGA